MGKRDKGISVLIADGHTIFREGLKALLSSQPEIRVVGETGDGGDVCRFVGKLKPDVLLLDLAMPRMSGMDVLRRLAESPDSVRAVVLCAEIEAGEVSKIFELGARGLVTKDSTVATLFKCIRTVMDGQYWIGRESVGSLVEALKLNGVRAKGSQPKNYGLTPREMEVVRAVVSGCSNKQIAGQYKISEQTVKHHITNIFDKLGVYNRLELTLFVLHHELLEK